MSTTPSAESSGPGSSHQEQRPPPTRAESDSAGPSAPPALRERSMLPEKHSARKVDAGSERLRQDVDCLTPLFLEVLDEMERAGLTEHYAVPVRQAMRAYMTIMDGAWEALATERLSQVVNEPGYQHEIAKLQQWLLERKQRCAEAIAALQAKGEEPSRPAYSWRRRTRLYRQALRAWEQSIDQQGDARISGHGLFRMHGYYGLSALRSFELWVLGVLRWAIVGVTALVLLAYLVSIPFTSNVSPLAKLAMLLLLGLIGYYVIHVTGGESAPILSVIGYALAPRQKVTFTDDGIRVVPTAARRRRTRQLLQIWCALVLGAAPLIWFFAAAGLGVLEGILMTHESMGQLFLGLSGDVGLLLVMVLPLSYLFFLPFVLYTQVLLSRDLGGHPDWEVAARRYALRFSMILLPFEMSGTLVISIALRQWWGLQDDKLLEIGSAPVTAATVLYVLAFLFPYLAFVDLPYRYGVDRWRLKRLKELRSARRLAEEEIARLPLRGEAKADLHELEYHLGWLEYYRATMEEVKETPESPFSVERRTTALLLATPLPLIIAALQDIRSGEAISQDVVELLQVLLRGGGHP